VLSERQLDDLDAVIRFGKRRAVYDLVGLWLEAARAEGEANAPTWRSMDSAPKDASWVRVRTRDGKVHRAHYAEDMSGSEQPPFRGWFIEVGGSFVGLRNPEAWAPELAPAQPALPAGLDLADVLYCAEMVMALQPFTAEPWRNLALAAAKRVLAALEGRKEL